MAEIVCEGKITRIDMLTYHIHGTSNGGTFMFRPIAMQIMDKAMAGLGKNCRITLRNALITDVEVIV
jgi:hypothetical protein